MFKRSKTKDKISDEDMAYLILWYNLNMAKDKNILISEQKLKDLQGLSETLVKIIKISEGATKKNAEKTLSEVIIYIGKALKNEILTVSQYHDRVVNSVGGKKKAEKIIKEIKKVKNKSIRESATNE